MQEFRHIMFYEDKHIYHNTVSREIYQSVTQTISKIKPEVNWDYWAVYKYLETLGSVRPHDSHEMIWFNGGWVNYLDYLDEATKVRKKWSNKGKVAREKGTFIHLYLENLFNNKVISVPTQYKDNIEGANRFYKDHKHWTPIYAELIVADDDYKIAGQVDRPFFVEPGILDVYDWKTDSEIKTENKYSTLLPPVDDLPDCNFSKYTLQLNLYKWIIEKNTEWKVRDLKIVHLTDTNYELYNIPNYNVQPLLNEVCRTHKQPETFIKRGN